MGSIGWAASNIGSREYRKVTPRNCSPGARNPCTRLVGVHGDAAIFAGDLDADEGTPECDGGAVPIDVGVVRSGDAFLCTGQGSFRAGNINLFGALGGL